MAGTVSFIRGKFLIPFKSKKIYIQSELCTENLYAEPVRLWIFIITELYPWVHSLQASVNIKCQAQMLCERFAGRAGSCPSLGSPLPVMSGFICQVSLCWAGAPGAGSGGRGTTASAGSDSPGMLGKVMEEGKNLWNWSFRNVWCLKSGSFPAERILV